MAATEYRSERERRMRGGLSSYVERMGMSPEEAEEYIAQRLAAPTKKRGGWKSQLDLRREAAIERAQTEAMTSTRGRCGHTVEGTARDTIRRMKNHLDGCR